MHLDPYTAGLLSRRLIHYQGSEQLQPGGKREGLICFPQEMSRDKHVFIFPVFPLDHEHVQKINMICLEEACGTMAIVYKSRENLRTALEFYLTDKTPGFKAVYRAPLNDPNHLHIALQQDEQFVGLWDRRQVVALPTAVAQPCEATRKYGRAGIQYSRSAGDSSCSCNERGARGAIWKTR